MGSIFRMCESFFVHAAPDLVTLACFVFETIAIDDVDLAAPITDQALRLKLTGYQCHRASLHAEHFGKKFVCQRQHVAVGAISRLQQPTAKTLLDMMECVASR
jgi:hypothetical protein